MDAPWPPQTKPGPQPINLWMAPMKFMDGPDPKKIYGWPPTEIHFYTPWTPMDPPQTHFRVAPMKFMDGPQLLTTYGCPQKWKTDFSAITWNSHLHPMTSMNPPQTHLWMAPMKFMDGPQSLTTYGWPRQAKNCILDYNIVVCINIQCCCMKPPKIYEWPPRSLWRPQNLWMAPKIFR